MSPLRILLSLAIASAVWALGHVYVGRRLLPALFPDDSRRRRSWVVVFISWALGPLVFLSVPLTGDPLVDAFQRFGYLVLGFFSILFAFVLARDVLFGAISIFERAATRGHEPDATRRELLGRITGALAFGASAGITVAGHVRAVRTASVERVDLRISGLSADLEGFRIAQISDIHVGPAIRRREVRAIVEKVNALSPDLIAITGDLVDGSVERIGREIAPLRDLRATHGAFFCTGNHEYYSGAEAWLEEVKRHGIGVLGESHELLTHGRANVLVAGVHDPEGERYGMGPSRPRAAIEGAPARDYSILLAHRPSAIREAAAAGFDLQLSGHTHGGQYFPYTWVVRLVQRFDTGLHRVGGAFLYVNRGTGFWGPSIRLGSSQEITLLTLRRAV